MSESASVVPRKIPAGGHAPAPHDAAPDTPGASARFRTPADPTPIPGPADPHDLSRPEYYLNRELTWLNFNFRVLHEAEDARTPLLERVKFLSIVGSNLDEFFMKRIGGLKQLVETGITERTVDGRTPVQQIEQCYEVVSRLEARQRRAARALLEELAGEDIHIADWDELDAERRKWLRKHYVRNIYPLVTPQATDPAHPFPFISNLSLNLLVTLRYPDDEHVSLARVKVPVGTGIPRFVPIEGASAWVPLESVMANNLDLLFPGMEILACEYFRVTRNAIYDVDEDMADDLLELIEAGLRKQRLAPIVRLQVQEGFDPRRLQMLTSELGLKESDVFEGDGLLGLRDLMAFHDLPRPGLKDAAHHPSEHPDLLTGRNIFHIIREEGPILLHHPYQAFDTSVLRFLHDASRDPKVRAIKMTFYRMAPRSSIIDHLVRAARDGKQVAVVIELRARFDEAANIQWANALATARDPRHLRGPRPQDPLQGHAGRATGPRRPATLCSRRDRQLPRRHGPAVLRPRSPHQRPLDRRRSDRALQLSHHRIQAEAQILEAAAGAEVSASRDSEADQARNRDPQREVAGTRIQFQMNALEDPEVTRALYVAASKGVEGGPDRARQLSHSPGGSRGCPRTSAWSASSGRFLQHSRIYYFRNGGDEEYYIGSADCMGRNLSARVEALVPVESAGVARRTAPGPRHPAGGPALRLGDGTRRQLHPAQPQRRGQRDLHLPTR